MNARLDIKIPSMDAIISNKLSLICKLKHEQREMSLLKVLNT